MGPKEPADFDCEWYAATYADVGMSGLHPREHYRLFGRLLGRGTKPPSKPARAAVAAVSTIAPPEASEPAIEATSKPAAQSQGDASTTEPSRKQQPKESAPFPIIDRPNDFDPAASVPNAAPPKAAAESGGPFTLDNLVTASDEFDATQAVVTPALDAYSKLLNLGPRNGVEGTTGPVSCGALAFQAGASRIENAWFAGPNRLRLMFAGGTETVPASSGWAVRAYQGECANPASLRMLGPGIELPPIGPVIHDIDLLHPLMPLLLELSDAEGTTRAFTLLPFPSLLRGGLHSAELKALQTEPNPIGDFWALSDALLKEALGREGWPERSVGAVSIHAKAAKEEGRLWPPSMQEWLDCVFGIAPPDSAGGKRSRSKHARLQLALPPDFVPTISALVSRRLGNLAGAVTAGSYLVSDADDFRPRWSIGVPADAQAGNAIPTLRRPDATAGCAPSEDLAPMPLAIALRSPTAQPSVESGSVPATKRRTTNSGGVSLLVDASDAALAERTIEAVLTWAGGEVELFVRVARDDAEIRSALERMAGTSVPASADLREIAMNASHETVLTISDRADPGDGTSLRAILDLLQRDETTGSASCALLAEKIIKKDVVLQPASGGLFPTGVSFASGPRLAFGEPDALQALPELDYPVVANTLLFTAWRRRALAELPAVPGTGWANTQDVRLGLDLMRMGYRNWCTTRSAVRLLGPYVPRDGIDPVGPGYLQPEGWEDILRRVTVVRELF